MYKMIFWSILLSGMMQAMATGQSITPSGIVVGGSQNSGTGTVSWSIGQICSPSLVGNNVGITPGIQQPEIVWLQVKLRAFLHGPYQLPFGLMRDDLRSLGALPIEEPYTQGGFLHAGHGGGEQMDVSALAVVGPDAIVDWVFLELRSSLDPASLISTRSALIQRDGDVVDMDGISTVRFQTIPGNYHLVIKHRNHLPVMTSMPISFAHVSVPLDLTDGSVPTYGFEAQIFSDGVYRSWAGDVNSDGVVKYTNSSNDKDLILVAIGGIVPTSTVSGYMSTDINLDGSVKYVGDGNDRDLILITTGGLVPTAVRVAQIP